MKELKKELEILLRDTNTDPDILESMKNIWILFGSTEDEINIWNFLTWHRELLVRLGEKIIF